jgi:hypothetical protein
LSRVTGCRWRLAGCKGSFAALVIRQLMACQRALASGRLRGRSGMFRKAWNKRDQPRKGPDVACGGPVREDGQERNRRVARKGRLRGPARKTRLESRHQGKHPPRDQISTGQQDRDCFHDGRGWFDPLSTAKGDVFSLAEHLGAGGFTDACDRVADVVGFVPSAPVWQRPAKPKAIDSIAVRWRHRFGPRPGSPTWRYLIDERHIPHRIIAAAVTHGRLREGPVGSMWAAHTDSSDTVTGWEERGPSWRGFATGGAKELFRLGASDCTRVCVTEAAVDAMSLAALEELRDDTLYVSTGGGWAPATEDAIRALARRANVLLVAATDNNRQGEVYAGRIRAIAEETGSRFARSRPRADDWNEDLSAA